MNDLTINLLRSVRHLAPLLLAGCGVGSAWAAVPMQTRTAAAGATARTSQACVAVQPFYWEIGDRKGALASGSVDRPGHEGAPTYTADTTMNIASASKWLFGAYVVQRADGHPTQQDITFLNFRSGYTHFRRCTRWQTVDGCVRFRRNGEYDAATAGKFDYNGGHMEKLAQLLGMGGLDNAGLAAAMQGTLGTDIPIRYSQPQLAGGAVMSAAGYARFLRKLLDGQLLLGRQLGAHAVCTNPATCPDQAVHTPVPSSERWQYALGYWVESDPKVGDGAFSSPGAFGFYPWIDASRSWYGILARRGGFGAGVPSAECGRLIRKAWITGVAQ